VLSLAHGGTAQIVVEYETSGLVVVGPALVHGVGYAHVCGGIKGKTGVHDLETGRVHRGGSMKEDGDEGEGGLEESKGFGVEPGLLRRKGKRKDRARLDLGRTKSNLELRHNT